MIDSAPKDELLTAAECAARIGLTVRALRVYERHRLLAPKRTEKGWRLYGAAEIARLHEILALKQLGLSLSRIAALLEGRANDLDRALAIQEAALSALRSRAERGYSLVAAARARLRAGDVLSVTELVTLAKEAHMTESSFDAIAQRRYEQARPRKPIEIDPAALEKYVGHYKSEVGFVWDVSLKNDKLYFKNPGWPVANYALPEGEHQFFFPRWPSQVTFGVSPEGAVESLTYHSGGFENVAHRIDAAEAEREAAILAHRIRNKIPNPGSEELLRRVIASLQSGNVDFTQFIDSLSARLQLGFSVVFEELAAKGAVQTLAFRGVGPVGGDVYDVKFENENTEWRIGLAPDGLIRFLFWRSMP
ncbi:MerR family transcriptional regulator [Methylocystis iwaonis]|uniref:MerR family transcriptional regulator n=1 Tax=Methylocystis iwaonis TaxID=2885079 RepID=A0ABN6VGC3_9HYPH|nr:MerR family transcriptional regulator [Methylocystis iwaonis]BDV34734.1 MerR family transcriptional regulator [Methylocystis iwaonis]